MRQRIPVRGLIEFGVMILVMTTGHDAVGGGDGPAPFTEEAQTRGIAYLPNQSQPWGDGVAFADLDDDGDADIVAIGRADGTIGLFENDGTGHFTDRYPDSGLGLYFAYSGVSAADYDHDGDLDVYISRYHRSDVLLRNDGQFHFTDVTAAAGLGDDGEGAGSAWGDFDGDGWLDLYASVHEYQRGNRLYRNRGDGTFEDLALALGVAAAEQETFQACFFDYDKDGDPDLYLTNSYGQHCEKTWHRNLLYENVGGTFIDVTEQAHALACVDAMSIGIGDFDNNLYQDVYVTDNNQPGNALLLNQGVDAGGVCTFEDRADVAGVESFATAWGSVFFDYDHDGWMDLYVCNVAQPNRLYRHQGTWPCTDAAPAMGVSETGGASYSCAVADVDLDGDLDLLSCNRNAPLRLFINHEGTHEGTQRRWAKLDVVGEGRSRWAINAAVTIRTGDVQRYREVIAGSNYKNQNELVVHFGLDDAAVMDEIEVRWRSGSTRTLTGVPTNRTWTVYPTDKLGDGDGDGDRDRADFVRFVACFTGDAPGSLAPGCEMMDFDGDLDADHTDFDWFLAVYDAPLEDCDNNGVVDLLDILDGAADVNANGIIDACETVIGDLDGNLVVDSVDLAMLLSAWGTADAAADLDGNGLVEFRDLVKLLANWS